MEEQMFYVLTPQLTYQYFTVRRKPMKIWNEVDCTEYNDYLYNHKENVIKTYEFMELNNIIPLELQSLVKQHCSEHDESKWKDEEYTAYADYWNRKEHTKDVLLNYNLAWNHHIHNNPHHWQYWVSIKNDGEYKILDMPDEYIYEMLADWGSFKYTDTNKTAYKWYSKNKDKMLLSNYTKQKLDDIFSINNNL